MMIKGRFVDLRRMQLDDVEKIVEWKQNDKTSSYYDVSPVVNSLEVTKNVKADLASATRLDFTVVTKNKQRIGLVSLKRINWKARSCEIIALIGELDKRDFVFGAEAEFLLLFFSFFELNMNKVSGRLAEFAKTQERLVLDVGFKKEATLKQMFFHNGNYWDLSIFGLLRKEFINFLDSEKGVRYAQALKLKFPFKNVRESSF